MRIPLARKEALLLAVGAVLALVALAGPHTGQSPHYHHFADQRTLWGVPCALDVLSNLPFALAALFGGWALWRAPEGAMSNMQRAMAGLFFGGLLITALGSSWYHLAPSNAGLAIDRFSMGIAFAGILGLLAASQVSERAGAVTGLVLLSAAPASVAWWSATGDLLPWAALQGGGMVLILGFGLLRPRPLVMRFHWLAVIAAYGVAKMLEANDQTVFDLTGGLISGHSLKHIAAAGAALPIIAALRASASRQNASGSRSPAPMVSSVPHA